MFSEEKRSQGRSFILEEKRSYNPSFISKEITFARIFHCISYSTLLISSFLNWYSICLCPNWFVKINCHFPNFARLRSFLWLTLSVFYVFVNKLFLDGAFSIEIVVCFRSRNYRTFWGFSAPSLFITCVSRHFIPWIYYFIFGFLHYE